MENPAADSSAVAAVELRARRAKHPEAVGWILAAVFALSWYGFWWFWLAPIQPAGTVVAPVVPHVAVLLSVPPGGASNVLSDARALWSPVVFSLPSRGGFSRLALTNEIGARPPLDAHPAEPIFLERGDAPGSRGLAPEGLRDAMNEARKHLARAPDTGAGAAVFSIPATSAVPQVVLSDGLEDVRFQDTTVPDRPALRRDSSWEVSLHVEVGADGRVERAFLESGSASRELDSLLVRTVLAWRAEKPSGGRSGTVTFRSVNGPPLTADSRQAVSP